MARSGANGREVTLDEGELEIAKMYLEGLSTRAIASRLQMGHGSIARILRRSHVSGYVEEAQRDAMDALRRQMAAAGSDAFSVLREIAGDRDAPAPARVQAARTILDRVLPARTAIEGGDTPISIAVRGDVSRLSDDELRKIAGEVDK